MATYYMTQAGAGSQNGTSEANAWSLANVNTAGNWASTPTAGKISPGDTLVMNGTITDNLTVRASGTSGNPITLLFGTGAKFAKADWSTIGIAMYTRSFITIDGGATGIIGGPTGNASHVNGIIEATNSGTNLSTQINGTGVLAQNSNNIRVINLCVRNMYVRENTAANGTNGNGSNCIRFEQSSDTSQHNLEVDNCLLHDAYTGLNSDYGPGANTFTFTRVTAYRCNWGGRCGSRNSTSTMTGLTVTDCNFYNWTNWDSTQPPHDHFHHNGFFLWCNDGTFGTATFARNVVGPDFTTYKDGYASATAGIFVNGKVETVNIYNNLFIHSGVGGPANGMITIGANYGVTQTARIFNNTFAGNQGYTKINVSCEGSSTIALSVKNNLHEGGSMAFVSLYNAGITLTADHNLGNALLALPFEWNNSGSGVGGISLASWKTATGQDADWITADPLLTETYRLGAGSPAIGEGENLSAYFTTDAAGNTRPASGAWDIGAFQYGEAPPPTPPAARGRKRRGAKLLSFFR
jgi:hypothetical protein